MATVQARATEREQLEADVAAFLAKGGIISQPARSLYPVKWMGNEADAKKLLKPAGTLAGTCKMSVEKFELMAREPGFPTCYLFKGEQHWASQPVREYMRRKRGIEF